MMIPKREAIKKRKSAPKITRTQSFQYRRDFDISKDLIEHCWSLKVKRAIQIIKDHMRPYGTIRGHTGPKGTIGDHMDP